MTRDARLSALHRGGFSPGAALPSPASALAHASAGLDPCSELPAARSSGLAGRGPRPPEQTVTSRRRRTPLLAPPSGCLRTTPSMSEDANPLSRLRFVVK